MEGDLNELTVNAFVLHLTSLFSLSPACLHIITSQSVNVYSLNSFISTAHSSPAFDFPSTFGTTPNAFQPPQSAHNLFSQAGAFNFMRPTAATPTSGLSTRNSTGISQVKRRVELFINVDQLVSTSMTWILDNQLRSLVKKVFFDPPRAAVQSISVVQ